MNFDNIGGVVDLLVFEQTCLSNGVPCIVFRGVSDFAGGAANLFPKTTTTTTTRALAAINALNVAVEFIGLLKKESNLDS